MRAWRAPSRTSACSATCRSSTMSWSVGTCATARASFRRSSDCRPRGRPRRRSRRRTLEILDVLGLRSRARERVADLPYGDQRKVEFARALATEPPLLLLDEPTAGMNRDETADLAATIRRMHAELGIAMLLVEHDMQHGDGPLPAHHRPESGPRPCRGRPGCHPARRTASSRPISAAAAERPCCGLTMSTSAAAARMRCAA